MALLCLLSDAEWRHQKRSISSPTNRHVFGVTWRVVLFLDSRLACWLPAAELNPQDADKTALITRSGQYHVTVLSMSLANAPSQFQSLMDSVLSGVLWGSCLVYLDEIIVSLVTFDKHLERFAAVFERLAKANFKLKASKCLLFRGEVHFHRHIISKKASLPIQRRSKSWQICLVLKGCMM
jgi:Reverse transcriptase (RNA-dependent DNA polymerase)